VADVRSQHAVKSEVLEFGRQQKVKDAETDVLIEQKESEADIEEARQVIEEVYIPWKKAKAAGRKGEAGDEQEVVDKERTRELGRYGSITINGSIIRRSNIDAGAMKKCSHCGAALPMYASFCGECGKKLG
jgi:hypothetical protein